MCIKCGYCYSCHWKKEQVEEIELRDKLKDFYVSLPKAIKDDDSQKVPSQQDRETLLKVGSHYTVRMIKL